jgi:AcrR family transcriptional regulator
MERKRKKSAKPAGMPGHGSHMNREKRGRQIATYRKRQITRAAYETIAEKGYYNFTMMDIARKAGVSSGLIHHYFKDKENMLVSLLREMQQNIRTTVEKAIDLTEDPVEKLDIFMNQAFNLVEEQRDYIYVTYDFLTQIKFNERMKRIMSKLYRGYRETMVGILKYGKEKGVFKEVDEHYIATLFISAMLGLEQQYIIDNSAFFYREYTIRIKKHFMNLIMADKKS